MKNVVFDEKVNYRKRTPCSVVFEINADLAKITKRKLVNGKTSVVDPKNQGFKDKVYNITERTEI